MFSLMTPRSFALLLVPLAISLSGTAYAQHDGHREATIDMNHGRAERAQERLETLLEDPVALWRGQGGAYARVGKTLEEKGVGYFRELVIPETHYTLSMLHSMQGDAAKALEHAQAAVAKGLQVERFVAGPREAFAALYAAEGYREWLAAQHPQGLLHGPMLGHVTEDAASFWVRTAEESAVTIQVTPEYSCGGISASGTTRSEDDYTAVIRIDGLQPDSEYSYRVMVDGALADRPKDFFRTAPERGQASSFRVVFTACAGYAPEHERIWHTIKDQEPMALLMLGDNVYIDDPEHEITQQFCYYRRYSRPEWRDLVASTGVYAIWDDHDFGLDDSFGGPEIDEPAWKREVFNVFRQNWNNPAYGGGDEQPGVWFDFYIGDVHFIMLDGRYYREANGRFPRNHPPQSENPVMLGPVQLAWLKETLLESRATFRVIASPVPWADGVAPRGRQKYDKWEGFPAERQAIFDHLAENEINGVLLISGDRHRADVHRIDRENGYSLYDFMSAMATNYHTHPLVEGSGFLFGYNEKNNFGVLEFDTNRADPTITMEIRNIDDESVWTHELRLSELSH